MKQEYLDILEIESEEELRNVNWHSISCYQKLSEDFIREFKDYVDWYNISCYQKLSEDFIREFKNYVDWHYISSKQKLSEDFIREFKDKVNWCYISTNHKLSTNFIDEFKDSICWECFSLYSKLSEEFIEKFREQLSKNNWKYANKEIKMKSIKDCGLYEIDGDYIFAYKTTKKDGYSIYYPSLYQYKIGNIYESDCDCNIRNGNSFGLSAWTKEGALNYYDEGELYKVKIHIDDVGAFIKVNGKLRCFKLEILERIQ